MAIKRAVWVGATGWSNKALMVQPSGRGRVLGPKDRPYPNAASMTNRGHRRRLDAPDRFAKEGVFGGLRPQCSDAATPKAGRAVRPARSDPPARTVDPRMVGRPWPFAAVPGDGRRLTVVATAALGARAATIRSISRLLVPEASSKRLTPFASVI